MSTWKFDIPTMPNNISMEKKVEILQSTVEELLSRFSWFTSNFDSKNVKRLDTNETVIKSADGETIIRGPVLEMYDKQATPVLRLKQGYDSVTGKFVYELYDAAGVKTVGIDSNGAATFTGTITGGTIQTNTALHSRIVITGDTLKTYYSNGVTDYLNGVAWGIGALKNYGDLNFYDTGVETLRIENALAGGGWNLRPMNGGTLVVGYGGENTYASGVWDFSTADSVSGLVTDSALSGIYAHSHTVY